MKMLETWKERKKPDLNQLDEVLWKDFQFWAASNRWDVTIPKEWVRRDQFVAFLSVGRATI